MQNGTAKFAVPFFLLSILNWQFFKTKSEQIK
jgi:hypothetical protein